VPPGGYEHPAASCDGQDFCQVVGSLSSIQYYQSLAAAQSHSGGI